MLGSDAELRNLVFRGLWFSLHVMILLHTTVQVWGQMTVAIEEADTISLYTPLWGNYPHAVPPELYF